jgi:hypothetical protein
MPMGLTLHADAAGGAVSTSVSSLRCPEDEAHPCKIAIKTKNDIVLTMLAPIYSRRQFIGIGTQTLLSSCVAGVFAAAGCQSTRTLPRDLLRTGHGQLDIVISFPSSLPKRDIQWVEGALPYVEDRFTQFCLKLSQRVLVEIHPTVRGFVNATGQTKPWLRAWATYATVHLLTPDHWGNRSAQAKAERLAHELTHCTIYQAFPSAQEAARARIPFWFQEGLASVVAGQGHRRMPMTEIVQKQRTSCPLVDRVASGMNTKLAYGASHHAVAQLAKDHSPKFFGKLLSMAAAAAVRKSCIDRQLHQLAGLTKESLWERTMHQTDKS